MSLFTGQAPRGPFPGFDWSTVDGSKLSSGGSPQIPALLNGYVVRPPWGVAGVDYAVGVHSNITPVDPFSNFSTGTLVSSLNSGSSANGTFNTGNNVLTFSGNNVIISGWDFGLHGGVTVQILGTNVTLQDCKFTVGANGRVPILIDNASSGVTVTYCTIDGNQTNTVSGGGSFLIELNCQGISTFTYNYMLSGFSPFLFGAPSNVTNVSPGHVVKYNLLRNDGYGSPSVHGDWWQLVGPTGQTWNDIQINFNSCVQDDTFSTLATQGLSLMTSSGVGGNCLNYGISNNTFVMNQPATVNRNINNALLIQKQRLNGTATVHQNYIDPTGIFPTGNPGAWIFFGDDGNGGSFNGVLDKVGNLNMLDGTTL